jgi:CHAD domain-containing protein
MMRHVLHEQVSAMCALRKKAVEWSDPEGVHDMRVLSRRLRSAITDFEPYLRKSRLPLTKLRAIARSLGQVRDEDVALAALEKLKTETHGVVAQGLETLINERQLRRDTARAELKKAIRRSAIDELLAEFQTRLGDSHAAPERPVSPPIPPPPTFRSIGARVIGARLKELRAAGTHIFFPSENKELHELRIVAKGLRYACELFAACWGEDMRAIAKEIALLQTSLGELHDCDVWIEELGVRLKRAARRGRTDPEQNRTTAACTWLLKHFAKIRTEHYRDALSRWQQWQTDGFLHSLTSLIGS